MKTIVILALEGLFDSSLAVTLDVLRSAKRIHDGFCGGAVNVRTKIVGVNRKRLRTGEGLEFRTEKTVDEVKDADFVIVPGLGVSDPKIMTELLERASAKRAVAFLSRMHEAGATIAASCSATFLLAEAGLFGDRHATTSWWLSDSFRIRYPEIDLQTDRLLVSDGQVICAGAAMAQADLMMAVVSQIFGEETARLTASYLLIDRREFQSQYIMSGMLTHRHPEVAKAERWIRANISRGFSISDLADKVGVSPRTLARRVEEATGVGPLKFVQQLRIETAIHLLETTSRSFESIAAEVGYMDASSLRRLLHKHTGRSPSQFRALVS